MRGLSTLSDEDVRAPLRSIHALAGTELFGIARTARNLFTSDLDRSQIICFSPGCDSINLTTLGLVLLA